MSAFTVVQESRQGDHRANEDAYLVRTHPGRADGLLVAVADGQGGRAGGGPAARRACEASVAAAVEVPFEELLKPGTWPGLLRRADDAVAADPEAGFTTLVAFALSREALCGGSCGDSAALAATGEKAPQILTSRQHKDPPVGCGGAVFVPFAVRLIRPWTVLALTDGVWKYAGWEAVLASVSLPAEEIVGALLDRALLPGSGKLPDDFTLVVIR
jgi:hypothetical protein